MLRNIALLLLMVSMMSCQEIPEKLKNPQNWFQKKEKKQYVREYYPNGNIKSINEAVGDMRDGVSKYYYEDGKLQAIAHFKMNKYHGEQISYYRNGKVRGTLNYVDHKKQGKALGYYENGSLYTEENYQDGKLHGLKRKYYQNGKLMMENQYLNGEPSINLKEYNNKGQLITDYPNLIIEPVNHVALDNQYILKIYFSNKTRSAKFYIDNLIEGEFLPAYTTQIIVEKGVGTYTLRVNPGEVVMEEINIIGTMQTRLGHTRVVSKPYYLAVKN